MSRYRRRVELNRKQTGAGTAGVKFSRITDLAPLSWDQHLCLGIRHLKLRDPLPYTIETVEFCSAMSLLVIAHHDSYKCAIKTFLFQHVDYIFRPQGRIVGSTAGYFPMTSVSGGFCLR